MYINIEIKRTGLDDGICDKVVNIIRAHNFQNEGDITSMDYETLQYIHERYPDILLAYTAVVGFGKIQNLDAVDIISIQETFATFETVEAMHKEGKKVFVWTVNDFSTMEKLCSLNVDAILTNNPKLGKQVIDDHQGMYDIYMRIQQLLYYMS